VVLMFDGVAVDPKVELDNSVLPHQVAGLCRHCQNASFSNYDDYEYFRDGLLAEQSSSSIFHQACEAEVVVLGFIGDSNHTHVIPVAISPTCKKDDIVGQSTNSIKWIMEAVIDAYNEYNGPEQIGPIMTLASDGAPHFAKAAASMLSEQMPDFINDTYRSCALFNLTGGSSGCTRTVDWDHCGKRTRERIKGIKGLKIGSYTFDKASIALYGA